MGRDSTRPADGDGGWMRSARILRVARGLDRARVRACSQALPTTAAPKPGGGTRRCVATTCRQVGRFRFRIGRSLSGPAAPQADGAHHAAARGGASHVSIRDHKWARRRGQKNAKPFAAFWLESHRKRDNLWTANARTNKNARARTKSTRGGSSSSSSSRP